MPESASRARRRAQILLDAALIQDLYPDQRRMLVEHITAAIMDAEARGAALAKARGEQA